MKKNNISIGHSATDKVPVNVIYLFLLFLFLFFISLLLFFGERVVINIKRFLKSCNFLFCVLYFFNIFLEYLVSKYEL